MSLFGVKLAHSYRESHEEEKIDHVVNYLSHYICKHLPDFVETDGGWVRPNTKQLEVKALVW